MKSSKGKQRGMTFIGWLTVLALIGFFVLLGLKLVPIYLDHYSAVSTLKTLEKEPLITKKSVSEIKQMLKKRFNMNYITELPKDAVKIQKTPGVFHALPRNTVAELVNWFNRQGSGGLCRSISKGNRGARISI